MKRILSTTYFGPIQYYSKLLGTEEICIELYEHYPKQTYRNRCIIYGANGPQVLTIPVSKGDERKVFTRDIRIDDSMNWRKIHLKAIESAYRCSPFYLHYADEIVPLIEKKKEFLYDFNGEITEAVCNILGIKLVVRETTDYHKIVPQNFEDFRESIHPKIRMHKPDTRFNAPVYHQVFEPKFGFLPNLSIIDLIFNTGPEAIDQLLGSLK